VRAAIDPTATVAEEARLEHFRPIRLRKAADEVVAVIVDAIRGGLYAPGEKLPRERDLAAKLEVSRLTVREAVAALQRAGIVSVKRGNTGGIFIKTRSIAPSVLATIEPESHANLTSLLEARRTIEFAAADLACQRATDKEFSELARLVDLLPALLEDPDEFIAVDAQFHMRLGDASANPYIAQYARDLVGQLLAMRAHLPVGHVELDLAIRNQRDTLEALYSRRRSRVREAMERHLGSVEDYFLGKSLGRPAS
jgi:DNA-binding FadR family transcriptional regulator